jgi:hypothetical protein
MHDGQQQFSLFERWAMVAILLLVAAITIQSVWHEVKASEERTVNNAVGEYEALKKMYFERLPTLPPDVAPMNASGAVNRPD